MKHHLIWTSAFVAIVMASNVKAQIDSNSYVKFYAGDFSPECIATDSGMTYIAGMNSMFIYEGTLLPHGFNNAPFQYISFSIDSLHSQITIEYDTAVIVNSSTESGMDQVQVNFDSIPYSAMPDGAVIVEGKYPASYQFGSFRVSTLPHGGPGENCSSTGATMDSVYLRIVPKTNSVTSTTLSRKLYSFWPMGKYYAFNSNPSEVGIMLMCSTFSASA